MKIGIDISHLPPMNHQVGIHIYATHLLRALAHLNSGHQFSILHATLKTPLWFDNFLGNRGNVQVRHYPLPHRLLRWLWQNTRLPLVETLMGRPDLIHMMCEPDMVESRGAKLVVTLHDVITLKFPEFNVPEAVAMLERIIGKACQRADAIIASSFSTKNDLVALCGVDPEKVEVVHLAVDPEFKVWEESEARKTVAGFNLQDTPYFFFVSTIEIRKNVRRLIDAFLEVRGSLPEAHKLVLAGKRGWLSDDVFSRLAEIPDAGDILLLGRLSRRDIIGLMNGARAFVYPSLYEGFGFPPLEAMACGTPVITSAVSSIPEVVGDAAILVDPTDVHQIAAAMHRIVTDADLRTELIRKGLERVRLFTWENTARETLKVYEQVCGR